MANPRQRPSATLVAVKEKADKKNVGNVWLFAGAGFRAHAVIFLRRAVELTVFGLRIMNPPGPQAPVFMLPAGGLTTEAR